MNKEFWVRRAFVILLTSIFFCATLRTLVDPDIWFQLLAGKYVLAHHQVPHHDFFLYAGQNNPQQFGGWGFGLAYELVIEVFGLRATSFLNSLIWSGAFGFALCAAALRSKLSFKNLSAAQSVYVSLVLTLLYLACSSRMSMRAESTLIFAWAFLMWAYEWLKKTGKPIWICVILPAVAWLESFMHTGGFVLIALIPIMAADHVFSAPKDKRFTLSVWWCLSSLATIVLPILNPNGVGQAYGQLLSIIESTKGSFSENQFINLEYLPIWDPRTFAVGSSFAPLVFLLALFMAKKSSARLWFELSICSFFILMAALHIRGVSLAAMVLMVPSLEAAFIFDKYKLRVSAIWLWVTAFIMALAPLAIAYSIHNFGIQASSMGYEQEIALIKKNHKSGAHIFTVESGPKLAYALGEETFLVSKGGHTLISNPEANGHQELVINGTEIWDKELSKYKVDFVCVPFYLPMPGQGIFYWIPSMLVANPEWRLISINGCGLFERMTEENKLTKPEIDKQTQLYLEHLTLFSNGVYFGQVDKMAKEVGEKAQVKLKILKDRMKKEGKLEKENS
jgi:hypothetical protein